MVAADVTVTAERSNVALWPFVVVLVSTAIRRLTEAAGYDPAMLAVVRAPRTAVRLTPVLCADVKPQLSRIKKPPLVKGTFVVSGLLTTVDGV